MSDPTLAAPDRTAVAAPFDRLTRHDWLALADRFYRHLDGTFARLDAAAWQRATPYLGWSAHDVLAHMTSAMPVNFREVLDRALADRPVAPSEFDTFHRNARAVAERRRRPVDALLDEFRCELDAMLASYRAMSDDDWHRPAWFFVGPVHVRTLFLVQFADNVFHERDLLLTAGQWDGIDPAHGAPLVDWFFREFRPSLFRPDLVPGLHATAWYHLTGPAGGDWTMTIAHDRCRVERGASPAADVQLHAAAEDLVAAALARAAPWVGSLARAAARIARPTDEERFVARATGAASLGTAFLSRRIRIRGNRAIARRLAGAFWHFWERSAMTEVNIARG